MTLHDPTHDHAHFDAAAATWDADPAQAERVRDAAALLRRVLPLQESDRVLEIGGGTGSLSIALADRVGSILITDASRGMIEVARSNIDRASLSHRVSAEQLDLVHDPAPEGPFQGVWAQLALHHVRDLEALLRQVRGLLVPGGWLAVIELDDDRAHAFHSHVEGFTGHHGFNRDEFAELLRRNGFHDVNVVDAGSIEKELRGDDQGRGSFGMFLAVGVS